MLRWWRRVWTQRVLVIERLRSSPDILVLMAATVLLWTLHLLWWRLVGRIPSWDQAHHLLRGYDYAQAILRGSFVHQWAEVQEGYPPGYHLLLALATLIAGPAPSLGLFVNLLLLPVVLLSVWRVGTLLYGPFEGRLAAVLTPLFPAVALFTREAMIEFSLLAWTSATVWVLLETDRARGRRVYLVLALLLGSGLLVKPSFGFYVAGPMLYALGTKVCERRVGDALSLALAALVAAGIASTWYGPQQRGFEQLLALNRSYAERMQHPSGLEAVWYYVGSFGDYLTTALPPLLALAGLGLDLVTRRRKAHWVWLWFACALGALLLLISYRDPKYLIPVLPAVSLGVASLVGRAPRFRGALAAAMLLFQFLYFAHTCFGVPNMGSASVKVAGWELRLWGKDEWGGTAGGGDWATAAVLQALPPSPADVAVVPDMVWFNANILLWEARRRENGSNFVPVGDGRRAQPPNYLELERFTHVLLKSGYQGEDFTTGAALELNDWVHHHPDRFLLVASFQLPDQSTAQLFEVRRALLAPPTLWLQQAASTTPEEVRGAVFGDRLELVGVTWRRLDTGLELQLAWRALRPQELDRRVCVHVLGPSGDILAQSDYWQARHRAVQAGELWRDTVLVITDASRSTRVGICFYDARGERLPVDRGPRDDGGTRLLLQLL